MIYALNEWYITYINNSQNDQNFNFPQKWSKLKSETSFVISFVHWFQNWFRFFVLSTESAIFRVPQVLKITLFGSKKMGLSEVTTKIRNHFWNQCPKLIPKLVSDLNFDHFWGILKFWSFLNYKCMYCTIHLVRKPHNMKFLNDVKC